jgi:hypothetical protein
MLQVSDALKAVAESVFCAAAAIGLLDFVLQVISDGRVKLIHSVLAAVLGSRG